MIEEGNPEDGNRRLEFPPEGVTVVPVGVTREYTISGKTVTLAKSHEGAVKLCSGEFCSEFTPDDDAFDSLGKILSSMEAGNE